MEAIEGDFLAVGKHLERALIEYTRVLPLDRKVALLRALRSWREQDDAEANQYHLWETDPAVSEWQCRQIED
jgi:hypothetical protein